jgi:hypothetical protein
MRGLLRRSALLASANGPASHSLKHALKGSCSLPEPVRRRHGPLATLAPTLAKWQTEAVLSIATLRSGSTSYGTATSDHLYAHASQNMATKLPSRHPSNSSASKLGARSSTSSLSLLLVPTTPLRRGPKRMGFATTQQAQLYKQGNRLQKHH